MKSHAFLKCVYMNDIIVLPFKTFFNEFIMRTRRIRIFVKNN